jgi:hypothetical protein
MQLEIEASLNPESFLILNWGISVHFAYCRISGVDPNIFLSVVFIASVLRLLI